MKSKKGIFILAVCMLFLSVLAGCGNEYGSELDTSEFEENADFYLYNSLNEQEKEFYAHVCTAIEEFKTGAIFTFETEEERQAILDKFFGGKIYKNGFMLSGGEWFVRDVLYEQPQYFWVNSNNITCSISDYPKEDRYLLNVIFDYFMDEEEAMSKKAAFDNKVQEIAAGARAAGGTFEQVLYVHDYLCGNVVYDKALYESGEFDTPTITAYGALMEGKTICSGYAMAFSLLMRELGYDGAVEFNNYGQIGIAEGHVWNYVRLDGEYYYFDVTWDDWDDEKNPFGYEYFGLTTEEFKTLNFYKRDDAPVPQCTGTKYNYYVYNGFYMPQYSFEAASAVITKQINAGSHRIYLKFGDYGEMLDAEKELFTNKRIFELVDAPSVSHHFGGKFAPQTMYIDFI